MVVCGIDPGPEYSAAVWWNGREVIRCSYAGNFQILGEISHDKVMMPHVAVEMVQSYGRPAGAALFETAYWAGRFVQAATYTVERVFHKDIKLHFCGTQGGIGEAHVRQAIIDRFPGYANHFQLKGNKKNPGPLYGIKGHMWSALAVAMYAYDHAESKTEASTKVESSV